jgi:hypothetical protein
MGCLEDKVSLLGGEVLSLLPAVIRDCVNEPCWWQDELQACTSWLLSTIYRYRTH